MCSGSKWEEKESRRPRSRAGRGSEGQKLTSLNTTQLHTSDGTSFNGTCHHPLSHVVCWLCSPGQIWELPWNSVCHFASLPRVPKEPRTWFPYLASTIIDARGLERASERREALQAVSLTLVLAGQAGFVQPQCNQPFAMPSWLASSV